MITEIVAIVSGVVVIISEILPLVNTRCNGLIQAIRLNNKAFDPRLLTLQQRKDLEDPEFNTYFNDHWEELKLHHRRHHLSIVFD